MMANADIRSDFEIELTCPICLEVFTNPKILQRCLHSFCEECLNKLKVKDPDWHSVICPTCRQVTEIPEGDVSNLPNNFIISNLSLTLALHSKDSSRLCCGACTSIEDPPISFCNDCSHFLCHQCTKAHKKMLVFENHSVISMEELREKGVEPIPRKVLCKKHPKKDVEVYCNTCEILVCQLCALTTHNNHKFQDITEAYAQEKNAIQENLVKIKVLVPELKASLSSVLDSKEQLVRSGQEQKKNINQILDGFISVIEKQRNKLLNDVEQVQGQRMKVLDLQKEDIEVNLGQAESIQNFSQSVLNHGNSQEYLTIKTTIKNHLKELTDKQFTFKRPEKSTVSFHTEPKPEEIIAQLEEFGNVFLQYPAYGPMCKVSGVKEFHGAAMNMPRGLHNKLTVNSFNIKGEPLNSGGDKVSVNLTNTETGAVTEFLSSDNKDGSYDIIVDIDQSGSYQLSIIVNGEHTKSSPVNLDSWKIDSLKPVGKIKIFKGNLEARGKQGCWGAVVGDVCFKEGQHSWTIKVGNLSDDSALGLGVCLIGDHVDNSLDYYHGNKWTWSYYCKGNSTGCRYSPGQDLTYQDLTQVSMFQEGDILSLLLDCEDKTLTLTNTRSQQSDILTDVETNVTPYFCTYGQSSFSLE